MLFRRDRDPQPEDLTDAFLEGDRPVAAGTVRAALAHRDFRVIWSGTFASNVGTWMQNVLLGAYALALTGDPSFVGLLVFAQLGPLLFLGPVGGMLADLVDRRRLLLWMQAAQLVLSLGLAALAATPSPSRAAIFAVVLAIGVANALAAPALSAIIPTLVPRPDLPGAVSLQSAQMNLSRVIGPAIGAPLYAAFGPEWVFALNAATYLFAVLALTITPVPGRDGPAGASGWAHLVAGFRVAVTDPLIRRILVTLTAFSFFSLAFVGLMPVVARDNFGIGPRSVAYGLLYAVFGTGAAAGAVSVGTRFASRPKAPLARGGLLVFAGLLAGFALLRSAPAAYPVAAALGFAYFLVITSLATVLQEHLDDAVRGRVMALWIMAFGGTVPVGVLIAGFVARQVTVTVVLLAGAAVAAALAAWADLAAVGAPADPTPRRRSRRRRPSPGGVPARPG